MTSVEVAAEVAASPAKTTAKKPRAPKGGQAKPKKPSSHPPVSDMVVAAIGALKERNGSSLQAIKKYIAANYKCDVAKLAPFLRKALKKGIEKGTFVQTKGTGASGSFKLTAEAKKATTGEKREGEKKIKATTGQEETKKKRKVAKQPGGEKPAKRPAAAKKAKAAKSAGGVKKEATAPKQKATKPSKTLAKQPKTPKPKKAAPVKKATPKKKAAAKK